MAILNQLKPKGLTLTHMLWSQFINILSISIKLIWVGHTSRQRSTTFILDVKIWLRRLLLVAMELLWTLTSCLYRISKISWILKSTMQLIFSFLFDRFLDVYIQLTNPIFGIELFKMLVSNYWIGWMSNKSCVQFWVWAASISEWWFNSTLAWRFL